MQHDIVIVGGGPAGASAAIFAARAGLSTLVVDADKGITRRADVNNHLGLPDGIAGPELVERGRRHAVDSGAEWRKGTVTALEPIDGGVAVVIDEEERVEARDVVLTLGMTAGLAEAAGLTTTAGTEPRVATIAVVDDQGRTSLPGVWAAGTIAGTSVHTIITAGDGARVAINVVSAQKGERWVDHDVLPAPDAG